MNSNVKQLITFPFTSIIADILRHGSPAPISKEVADCIMMVCKNKHTCHVQLPSDDDVDMLGHPITEPRLWDMALWQSSHEKWLRAKRYMQRIKDDRDILEYNVRSLTRAILKLAYISPDAARAIAHMTIQSGDINKIKAFGVTKLITDVKEIH